MVRLEEWMEILDLSRQGMSISEIARRMGGRAADGAPAASARRATAAEVP